MTFERKLSIRINGQTVQAAVPAHRTLLEMLRDLGHVDVKRGCEKGDCGACAVLIDGEAIDSCLVLAWTVEGKDVVTVAGLGDAEAPHPLQKAFIANGAVQCGYCIPGMIIAAQSMLNETPNPNEDNIRLALSGNLCRCTGYKKIFEAVETAAAMIRGEAIR